MSDSTPQLVPQTARLRRARLWLLLLLIPIGVLSGIFSGALMNAVNGWMSREYFSWFVMRVDFISFEGWIEIVQHGMLEGAVFGVIFSVLYTTVVVFISHGHCSLRLALRGLFRTVFLLGLTSLLFRLNSVILAWCAFFDRKIGRIPTRCTLNGFSF